MKASELAKVKDRIVLLEETFLAANPGAAAAVRRLGADAGRAAGGGAKGFGAASKGFGAPRR
jgi:hypothetical protein